MRDRSSSESVLAIASASVVVAVLTLAYLAITLIAAIRTEKRT
jgi:hypothetical protein